MDQLTIEVRQAGELEPDALAIPFPDEDAATLSNGTRALDERLKGRLQRLVEDGELKGELGRTMLLHTDGELDAQRLILAGVGKREAVDADALRTARSCVVWPTSAAPWRGNSTTRSLCPWTTRHGRSSKGRCSAPIVRPAGRRRRSRGSSSRRSCSTPTLPTGLPNPPAARRASAAGSTRPGIWPTRHRTS